MAGTWSQELKQKAEAQSAFLKHLGPLASHLQCVSPPPSTVNQEKSGLLLVMGCSCKTEMVSSPHCLWLAFHHSNRRAKEDPREGMRVIRCVFTRACRCTGVNMCAEVRG